MNVLAIVPARCGSKGFPDKNIAELKGKTMLELAVKVGLGCEDVTDVYVSTDSEKYEKIALDSGAASLGMRPEDLAGDNAKSIDVVIDLVKKIDKKFDYLVLLQPTSPVRTPEDISSMLKLVKSEKADAAVSVCRFEEPHPFKMKSISEAGYVKPFIEGTTSEVPRQSLEKVYALNGAIYVTSIDTIMNEKTFLPERTIPYIMDENINIDSEEDFIFLEAMFLRNKVKVWGLND
jgi:CMP-N-acetylneuraminic acid synthetase